MNAPSPTAPASAFVRELLQKMTLAEKVGQMCQHAWGIGPASETQARVRAGALGSFLNATPLADRNLLQKIAVEETRLGIPLIFGRDVIHGYRTIFPIPLGLGATFDPGVVERACEVAAREAWEEGTDWSFAPMVDVTRDPRWGRVAESPSEDPYLLAKMGVAMVRGFQGDDPRAPGRVAACAKHFAGYGAAESGKDYNSTWIPEAQLRELHLASFRACVEAGVLTLMSGFNDLNGIPVTASEFLMRQVLKDEWGFGGMVVSDWASSQELIGHGIAANEREAARATLVAGLDMEMVTRCYADHLEAIVEAEPRLLPLVDEAVSRILWVKHRLGLFDEPYRKAATTSVALAPEHLQVAQEAAQKSAILLQNEGDLLPLSGREKKIALIGPLADDKLNQLGCWSFDGKPERAVTLREALEERLGKERVAFAPGVVDARSSDTSGFEAAVEAVQGAEVAIVVVGEDAGISGESKCRAFLDLPGAQQALLERLARTGVPLAVVVMSGRPLVLSAVTKVARSVLLSFHGGTMAGPALAELLLGDVSPSGRLPTTLPRAVGQIPIYYGQKRTGRPAPAEFRGMPEGTPLDPVGFSASYLDVEVSPLFPFGHGLSYTTVSYEDLRLDASAAKVGTPIQVSVRVSNTGKRATEEVVQLYVRDVVASVARPMRELKGFSRVKLAPGESRDVRFSLTSRELEFVGRDMKYVVEPGKFQVFVGGSSLATLSAEFELT